MPRLLIAMALTLASVCLNAQVNVAAPLLHLVDPQRIIALLLLSYCAAFWLMEAAQCLWRMPQKKGPDFRPIPSRSGPVDELASGPFPIRP